MRKLLLGFLIVLASIANAFADPQGQSPKIGIHYVTWHRACPPVWTENGWYPFRQKHTPVVSMVRVGQPAACYHSSDVGIATRHAELLRELGVDFVIFDVTNNSKGMTTINPENEYTFTDDVIAGFEAYPQKNIQVAFMLSLTSQMCPGSTQEVFEGGNQNVLAHINAIGAQHEAHPGRFLQVDGKPLLLFYVNVGSNVTVGCNNATPAFNGDHHLFPTAADWNPAVNINGWPHLLRNYFSVRFLAYGPGPTESNLWADPNLNGDPLWPYRCDHAQGCSTHEAAHVSLWTGAGRAASNLTSKVTAANNAGKKFIVMHHWNEFSTTDESYADNRLWTLEPNNLTHLRDGTPDPWTMFNEVKKSLNDIKAYRLIPYHTFVTPTPKCLDVRNGVPAVNNGARLQQWDCASPQTANQVFYVRSRGAGDDWYIVPDNHRVMGASAKCLDVSDGSTSDGARIQQWDCNGGDQQTFRLFPTNIPDTYEVQTKISGYTKCLDVEGGTTFANGADIQQYACLNGWNQRWKLVPIYN